MRKRVFGRHLKRDTNERKALFKNLMTELVLHEQITTTEEKAKSIRGQVEKLITNAKRKGQQAEYLLQPYLSAEAVKKVIVDIAPRFTTRPGGYTRLIKLGNRFSDNASMAIIELTEKSSKEVYSKKDKKESQKPKETKKKSSDIMEIQEAEIVSEESTKTEKKEAKKKSIKKKESTKEAK